MLGKKKFQPKLIYNLTLDDLVPVDNLYRRLEKFLDLRFVYKECEKLYGTTGKPSIDPVVFFKLELYGYFENIISDRELIRKASDSLSARYLLGYDIDEQLPWHSTISRTRALMSKETFESIFTKVLEMCYQEGLIEGKHQSIDSTLVKANASLDSIERKHPKLTVTEYIEKTYEQNKDEVDAQIPEEKQKSELTVEIAKEKSQSKSTGSNQDYESKTDPDSRMASKPGKPSGLYYSTHYSADSRNRIITDVLTTYADTVDSKALLEVYDRAENRLRQFGLTIEELSADKGYCSGINLRVLEQQGVRAYIPSKKQVNNNGEFTYKEFRYEEEENYYVCPDGKQLHFYGVDKEKQTRRYLAKKKDCQQCPLKHKCCPESARRYLNRTIYYKEYERLEQRLRTPRARQAYIIRKTVSEGLFAEAKLYHGLRKFMTRGIDKAQKRSYMIASVQNLKKVMGYIKKKINKAAKIAIKIIDNIFYENSFKCSQTEIVIVTNN